jgi:hypothetical protein
LAFWTCNFQWAAAPIASPERGAHADRLQPFADLGQLGAKVSKPPGRSTFGGKLRGEGLHAIDLRNRVLFTNLVIEINVV